MDDQRFDNLSRIIARSTTRRATVKGIAAAIGGGVFASVFGVRAQRAGAQGTGEPGDPCTSGDLCASGLCNNDGDTPGVCYCEDPAEPWRGCGCDPEEAGACGGGTLVCCASEGGGGICTSGSTGCNPTGECQTAGEACGEGAECCDGLACEVASGTCISAGCQDPGGLCEVDENCCQGTCMGGTCACLFAAEPWRGCGCDPQGDGQCGGGGGLICCADGEGGICSSASTGCNPTGECTQEPGQECSGDEECCTGTCMSGVCACLTDTEPWLGCPCDTGTEAPCGGGTVICCPSGAEPGGSGVCTNASVGCETPPLCIAPGDVCSEEDDRCCVGSCMSGICACEDPAEPWLGCPCFVGGGAACDSRPDLCCSIGQDPSDPGICVSPMTGCNPTGECAAEPGQTCRTDQDCCEGKCSNEGVCYCADPAEPLRGCSCHTGTEDPCGADTLLCCATTTTPGGPGICTPDRLGCEPVGTCTDKGGACKHDDECCDMLCCVDGGACGTPPPPPKPVKPADTTVTTLPSTGSGSDGGSDLATWIGAAAVAGAAAVIAGRKINPTPSEGSGEN